jgi:hypothetical protein
MRSKAATRGGKSQLSPCWAWQPDTTPRKSRPTENVYFLARFLVLLSGCARVRFLHPPVPRRRSHLQLREVDHAALAVILRQKNVALPTESGAVEAAGHRKVTALHGSSYDVAAEGFAEGKLVRAREGGHAEMVRDASGGWEGGGALGCHIIARAAAASAGSSSKYLKRVKGRGALD